jgi:hypothetical protein
MSLSATSSGGNVSISAIQVTGSAIAYTVPEGKTAKVRLVKVQNWLHSKILTIGNYIAANYTDTTTNSTSNSRDNSAAYDRGVANPTAGFVMCSSGYNFETSFMFIKEDHILVAGETVSQNDAGATFAYTIFEEDA